MNARIPSQFWTVKELHLYKLCGKSVIRCVCAECAELSLKIKGGVVWFGFSVGVYTNLRSVLPIQSVI